MFCLHVCMYAHHVCAWCPQRSEEVSDPLKESPGNACEPPCVCWASNLGPL